ncbi:MAG TPA: TRAP transporter substrate-binding protein [Longimicrobiaceae bacterium]|nr:TRAP transporter substrate-binding protein [Longimicrobiaceae bacterium]
MRKLRRLPVLLLLALLPALLGGCVGRDDTTTIKLAHSLDVTHPVHRAMEFMAERLAQKSGGTMRIDIYPSGQLGSERETLELLQIGSLGMTKVSSSVLEGFAPAFRVFGLPFLFRDDAHRFAVLDGPIGEELLRSTEPYRLRGLAYYDAGSRSFYTTKRPVRTPADLAGLKIRTQESAVAMQMVRTLGGSATPIAWGEVYTALQQGVADGAENNPPSFHLSRHYEVARYYTLNEHTAVPDVLVVATEVWDDLTPRQQRWLDEAAEESAEYQRKLWAEATEEALRAVEEAGVQVIRPDKQPFLEKGAPLLDEFRRDPTVGPLIQRMQAVR